MASSAPAMAVLAGPNGAGKTPMAPWLLRDGWGIRDFVNADEVAKGLSAFHPERVALVAGQMALDRMRQLSQSRKSFAIETTLAARTCVGMIKKLRVEGYRVHLVYVWLPNAELAVRRVADRARAGGHHIEDDVVRRRYQRVWSTCSISSSRLITSGSCAMALPSWGRESWRQVASKLLKRFSNRICGRR